ncbi:MAG: hypothetical protein WCK58_04375, partial [Chloroflexota bacterium]
MSGSRNTPPATRKERRATERRDRFESARADRQKPGGSSSSGGGPSLINTRTMTIVGVVVGLLIVAVVAVGQLGGKGSGKLKDPAIPYAASLVDGSALGGT